MFAEASVMRDARTDYTYSISGKALKGSIAQPSRRGSAIAAGYSRVCGTPVSGFAQIRHFSFGE